MSKIIKSRILEYFSKDLLTELYSVCSSVRISDNNTKTDLMKEVLNKHKVDYTELGPGTNRYGILIDNYVFKIALDRWGVQDNRNEFTTSYELQPFVIKVYETNGLIISCEYVTVTSREEFMEQKEKLQNILSILAETYLLGDVGTVSKNYLNWGYRDNGDWVILDFAYIYRITGEELLCNKCGIIVEYDENFHDLKCPKCNKTYSFIELRKKITMEAERKENEIAEQMAYKLTKSQIIVSDDENEKNKEDDDMKKNNVSFNENNDAVYDPELAEVLYLKAIEDMKSLKLCVLKTPVTTLNKNTYPDGVYLSQCVKASHTDENQLDPIVNVSELSDVLQQNLNRVKRDIDSGVITFDDSESNNGIDINNVIDVEMGIVTDVIEENKCVEPLMTSISDLIGDVKIISDGDIETDPEPISKTVIIDVSASIDENNSNETERPKTAEETKADEIRNFLKNSVSGKNV